MTAAAQKPLRVALGLDQARTSGWGIAPERGRVIHHGLARTHWQRLDVVELALEVADGDPKRVFVMFEQHDHMPLGRLGRDDHTTKRSGPRAFAVERGPKQIHGMGKAYGRWEAALDHFHIPVSMRAEVQPNVWRRAIHGVTSGDNIKQAAVDWALRELGEPLASHDEGEAVCITAYTALTGFALLDGERQRARIEARGKRELASQGALAFQPALLEHMTKGQKR